MQKEEAKPKTKTKAKIKNIEAYCPYCTAVQKMEVPTAQLQPPSDDAPAPETVWAKCKKCKQTVKVHLSDLKKDVKYSASSMDTSLAQNYSPMKSFKVGDCIFHESLKDFGVVIGKEILANGRPSIVVDFKENGKKKLLETISN